MDLADKLGLSAPKIIPHCMIINARSLAKPDAASALHAELHSNKIDICFVSETWLVEMVVHGRISKPLTPLLQGIERKSWLKLLGIISRIIHRTGNFMLTICYAKLVVVYKFYAFVNILDTLKNN